ncbi:MAG: hypothetical protein IKQ90_00725 [Ruminococcus sp.]|nr:hypothetical protein [Ruminococcus sp.]
MKKLLAVGAAVVCSFSFLLSRDMTASAYETVNAGIPVFCHELTSEEQHSYDIIIEPADASLPMPESSIITVDSGENALFSIDISEPGTYDYRVYERPGTDERVEYDDTVYLVSIFAENDNSGGLRTAVSAKDEKTGLKVRDIEFIDSAEEQTTTSSTATQTSTQTAGVSTTQPVTTTTRKTTIIETITDIMTGDTMPVGLLCCVMAFAAFIAASARRKKDGEE